MGKRKKRREALSLLLVLFVLAFSLEIYGTAAASYAVKNREADLKAETEKILPLFEMDSAQVTPYFDYAVGGNEKRSERKERTGAEDLLFLMFLSAAMLLLLRLLYGNI